MGTSLHTLPCLDHEHECWDDAHCDDHADADEDIAQYVVSNARKVGFKIALRIQMVQFRLAIQFIEFQSATAMT